MTSQATSVSHESPAGEGEDEYRILDLFAGPGGLDVAARHLGVESIGIEWDDNACETRYEAGLQTIHADVRDMRADPPDPRHQYLGGVNVLVGGPPCQTFSVAGTGSGRDALDEVKKYLKSFVAARDDLAELRRLDRELAQPESTGEAGEKPDPRTGLVLEPLRWIMEAIRKGTPFKAIMLEQVPTVLPVWQEYKKVLESGELGVEYKAVCDVLNTEEFGVPQSRRRAVLIARLGKNADVAIPEGNYLQFNPRNADIRDIDAKVRYSLPIDKKAEFIDGVKQKSRCVSMHEALMDCRSRLAESDPAFLLSPPGPTADSGFPDRCGDRFYVVSNYGTGGNPQARGRRSYSQPAFTVTGKIRRNLLHNSTPERFTIPEAGVLQTFPGNYPWSGNDRAQQVGNAVPPLFAIHVLAAALGDFGKSRLPLGLKELATWRWEKASPERAKELKRIGRGGKSDLPPDSTHIRAFRTSAAEPI
ncbi:DNA cytosine methyltransferase [Streptomyces sp. NPDC056600]|uniref:DNA cytosine methyltransferase n=1 Tax=Streptomyces sp. NPDC056600 TaxID=3345874 RepID=UPI00369E683C